MKKKRMSFVDLKQKRNMFFRRKSELSSLDFDEKINNIKRS